MTTGTVLEFLRGLLRLKNVQRAGWRIRGIRDCESVADHTWGTAVVCMLLCDILRSRGQNLDAERVLRLALLHDAGEAMIGDIPQPADELEMLLQAAEYEHVGYRCLEDFRENRRNRPFFEEFPPVAELVAELESRRPSLR